MKEFIAAVLLAAAALGADNAVVGPQSAANLQSRIGNLESVDAITIPLMLSYQGLLTDTAGRAVPNGNYTVTFRLFTQGTGGTEFWTETQSVQTQAGRFSCLLGKVTPILSMPEAGSCFLEMQVNPDPPMTPRIRIASAAYAYFATEAAKADSAVPKGYAGGDLTGSYPSPAIGTGKVNSDKILDHSIKGVDIAAPCSLVTQVGNPNAALMIRALNTGNGIRIDTADNYGIMIMRTRNGGIYIDTAGSSGISVIDATNYGIDAWGQVIGGYFRPRLASGIGMVAKSYNGVAADTAIRAYGKGLASGGWVTGFDDGAEAPSVVAGERTIIASGSARLSAGRAEISLPEVFARHSRTDIPVRLNVTPTADAPGLLVAERRGNDGFSVRLRRIAGLDGSEDAAFDWIAVGALEEPSTEPIPDPESKKGR